MNWVEPCDLVDWVRKPLHGREGDNITVHRGDGTPDIVQAGGYGNEGVRVPAVRGTPDVRTGTTR